MRHTALAIAIAHICACTAAPAHHLDRDQVANAPSPPTDISIDAEYGIYQYNFLGNASWAVKSTGGESSTLVWFYIGAKKDAALHRRQSGACASNSRFNAGTCLTNGHQITTGSCNPAPFGEIPASSNVLPNENCRDWGMTYYTDSNCRNEDLTFHGQGCATVNNSNHRSAKPFCNQ